MSEPPVVPPAPSWRERLDLIVRPGGSGPPPVQLVLAVVAAVAALVVGWLVLREPPAPPAESVMAPVDRAVESTSTTSAVVVVHAAGAVARPGVYELGGGARVQDLLTAAGGSVPGAQLDRLNLAAPLVDGTQVYVAREGEPAPAVGGGGGGAAAPAGPLDLNTATVEQLEELPGVGPATAQAIVSAREELGRFRSVDDLLEVRGIGPAKLDAVRDLVTAS